MTIFFFTSNSLHAQYDDIAPGWKGDKKRDQINTKMEELIKRVSFETECKSESITYMVVDKYNFYAKGRDHLNFPKTIILKACGNNLTYINLCIPDPEGNLKKWVDGTWTLDAASKKHE